jgi:hypothetical protein
MVICAMSADGVAGANDDTDAVRRGAKDGVNVEHPWNTRKKTYLVEYA